MLKKTLAITLLILGCAPASSDVIEMHKQAVFKVGTTGCSDWNIWTRVLDLHQYDEEAANRLVHSAPVVRSHFGEGVTVFVEDYSLRRASYCVRPPGTIEACSWVLSSALWPREKSEWKCSAETKGCEGWKKCSAETRFCEEDPGGQEGTCIRIPTSCGWVFH